MAVRVIKKYPNRRLYDTEISSYITVEDVRQLIVDGEDFEVRDAKTGEDLTRSILLQIIAEHEQDGQPVLSTQLRNQLGGVLGQTPWALMNQLTERNLQFWNELQKNVAGGEQPSPGKDKAGARRR